MGKLIFKNDRLKELYPTKQQLMNQLFLINAEIEQLHNSPDVFSEDDSIWGFEYKRAIEGAKKLQIKTQEENRDGN